MATRRQTTTSISSYISPQPTFQQKQHTLSDDGIWLILPMYTTIFVLSKSLQRSNIYRICLADLHDCCSGACTAEQLWLDVPTSSHDFIVCVMQLLRKETLRSVQKRQWKRNPLCVQLWFNHFAYSLCTKGTHTGTRLDENRLNFK